MLGGTTALRSVHAIPMIVYVCGWCIFVMLANMPRMVPVASYGTLLITTFIRLSVTPHSRPSCQCAEYWANGYLLCLPTPGSICQSIVPTSCCLLCMQRRFHIVFAVIGYYRQVWVRGYSKMPGAHMPPRVMFAEMLLHVHQLLAALNYIYTGLFV